MTELQPDQIAERWNVSVLHYEGTFEPFTADFAHAALDTSPIGRGAQAIDIGAGPGGLALELARRSAARVLAVDFSPAMVERIRARAAAEGLTAVEARVMDGQALDIADEAFDLAYSIFGIILFPNADRGFSEMRRVLRPGGRAAIVAWTAPERYELMSLLAKVIAAAAPDFAPPKSLPAQLRFKDAQVLDEALRRAGFSNVKIVPVTGHWQIPDARSLVDNIGFAPGMAALFGALGADRAKRVQGGLLRALEARHGRGSFVLTAEAHLATALA